jgi:hypothetical protein
MHTVVVSSRNKCCLFLPLSFSQLHLLPWTTTSLLWFFLHKQSRWEEEGVRGPSCPAMEVGPVHPATEADRGRRVGPTRRAWRVRAWPAWRGRAQPARARGSGMAGSVERMPPPPNRNGWFLPNVYFIVSTSINFDVVSLRRNNLLCFFSVSSLIRLSCQHFTYMAFHLIEIETIINFSLRVPS